ncbi:hypothetical protein [Actinoplanes sp. NPDC051494]|uniref:hypothetical protein n=1 Tax=Actinoplanes sp. NPDC051494 TaxID=3363907 RepID=UPI00379E1009
MRLPTDRPRTAARVAFCVLTVGVAFALGACAEGAEPTGSAPGTGLTSAGEGATPGATSTKAGSAGGESAILAGKRQFVFRPMQTAGSVLHVDDRGHLALTDGESSTSLFVLLPAAADTYRIRMAGKMAGKEASGEQRCIGLTENTAGSATLDAVPCDAGAPGQRFGLEKEKGQTYAIRTDQDHYVRANDETGVEAVADPGTTFSLIDNGAAPAGAGD